jgi:hypothetical protein
MPGALEDLVGNMTLSELAQRSGRSVGAIVDFALGSRSAARRVATGNGVPASGKRGRRSSAGAVDTRSAAGRTEFDQRVLEAVRGLGGTAQAADVERVVGGTPLQRRTSLMRLVKSRKLTRSGKARSTAYTLR